MRYLVENSVGRLWMLNHPTSHLIEKMDYYVEPSGSETEFLRITEPEHLTVMDPCCGSGHILTYAFDLLYAIYEEEGYAPSEIPTQILTHNLYGTEIDPRAAALAAFALMMKARARQRRFLRDPALPNIQVIGPVEFNATELDQLAGTEAVTQAGRYLWQSFIHADVLGSLIAPDATALPGAKERLASITSDTLDISGLHSRAEQVVVQAEYLSRSYAVVATNPPYMGSSNMGQVLSSWVKKHHPQAKSDLITVFMERACELCSPGGVWAMINLPSWMFLKSFTQFRKELLRNTTINSLIHLGRGIFGSDFGTVAFTTTNSAATHEQTAIYRRLFEAHVEVRSLETIKQLFLDRTFGRYELRQEVLLTLPGSPIAYWLSPAMTRAFTVGKPLGEVAAPKQGLATADNARFLRQWFEVSRSRTCFDADSRETAATSGAKWFPHLKGGEFRKWWGNQDYVVNWENDGTEVQNFRDANGKQRSRPQNIDSYFKPAISWSNVSSGEPSFRFYEQGSIFGHVGQAFFPQHDAELLIGFANSSTCRSLLAILSPTLHFEAGQLASLPIVEVTPAQHDGSIARRLMDIFKDDWNAYETSWGFQTSPLIKRTHPGGSLYDALERWWQDSLHAAREAQELETENNRSWAEVYSLQDEVPIEVPLSRISLTSNPYFRYAPSKGTARTDEEYRRLFTVDAVRDLISYGVGCLFGRYSLDTPGLVLAAQSSSIQDFLDVVPNPTFSPDEDGVIPITSGEWFTDDIVTRFRSFLAATFDKEHLEANLRLIEDSLGKSLRQYFVKDFYKDHCHRYSNRPIYWMASSRSDNKASFQALIYLHRYTPDTLNMVLGDYLREFQAKLRSEVGHLEQSKTVADQKRADTYRKALTECEDYERDTLFPLASRRLPIDLDDGVLVNYLRFGQVLQKIPNIEKKRRDVQAWTWPTHQLTPEDGIK